MKRLLVVLMLTVSINCYSQIFLEPNFIVGVEFFLENMTLEASRISVNKFSTDRYENGYPSYLPRIPTFLETPTRKMREWLSQEYRPQVGDFYMIKVLYNHQIYYILIYFGNNEVVE
jgi:hypothetical protein